MAGFGVYTAFDFHAQQNWVDATITSEDYSAKISKGALVQQFNGAFTQDDTGVSGQFGSFFQTTNGVKQWDFVSSDYYNIKDVQVYLSSPANTQSYYAYLFQHDDIVSSSGMGSVLDGYAGKNTVTYGRAVNVNLITGKAITSLGTDTLFHFSGVWGSNKADTLIGDKYDNEFHGGAGNDSMSGGDGDDILIGEAGSDNLQGNQGADFILGGAGNDVITGGNGNDDLWGDEGADLMIGGQGNDGYHVDNRGDKIVEHGTAGIDYVYSTGDYTLGANLELLDFGGKLGIGNSLDNTITYKSFVIDPPSKKVLLDGGAGADVMIGGFCNDTYIVDNVGDKVIEIAPSPSPTNGAGLDTVKSSVSFVLPNGIENLVLTGDAPIDGKVSQTSNGTLIGNAAANIFDSRNNDETPWDTGNDLLTGGRGDDVYVIANNLDKIIEKSNEGFDTVIWHDGFTYTLGANLERLELGKGAYSGYGNALNNVMSGNAEENLLDGKGGIDTISYAGAHRVNVDLSARQATGLRDADILHNFENIVGSSYDDKLAGDASVNVISGGLGNDRFIFNASAAADRVTDFHSGGDTIAIGQSGIRIGNGDSVVDHARSVLGPNGFAASDELVIVRDNIDGPISRSTAATAIGHAHSNYANGETALFVVDDGHNSAVYLFTANNADATVSANELTLIASLTGAASTTIADYVFSG